MNGWQRAGLWGFGLFVIALPAYWTGEDRYQCDGGDCDLAALNGLWWAVLASLAYIFIACFVELLMASRRNKDGPPGPLREKTPGVWP